VPDQGHELDEPVPEPDHDQAQEEHHGE
jgi:hypothetical protein